MNNDINLEVKSSSVAQNHLKRPSKILLFSLILFFSIWCLLCTVVISVFSFPVIFVRHKGWKKGRFCTCVRRFIQFYGRWIIRCSWPMIRIKVEIPEDVRIADPCIYVLNHFSFADVYFCGFLPGFETVIAVRSWPFKLPIYNIFMRMAGYMDVEALSGEEILILAAEYLKSGVCLLFFPEGHRSRTGQLLPLQKGAFRLAAENRVPVVPVTIEGTEYFGGYKSRIPSPCRIRLRFYSPLYAGGTDLSSINELRNAVTNLYLAEVYNKKPHREKENE